MSLRPRVAALLILALALAARPAPLGADASGTVAGKVCDTHGLPIAGATVTLAPWTGGRRVERTDEQGVFRFPAAHVGSSFTLTIEHPDFRGVSYEGFQLNEARTRRLDVRLKRPGEHDVVVLLSRDPYPFEDLLRGLLHDLDAPARVFDLDQERRPEALVRRIRDERPDLILGTGLLTARLLRREVRDIPAVLALISDPRRFDLGAVNLSFVATQPDPADLVGRIRSFLPKAHRLGILYDASASMLVARDLARAARQDGWEVVGRPCYGPSGLNGDLARLESAVDVVVVPFGPIVTAPGSADQVTGWALRHRVPLVAPDPDWVRRGALFSFGPTPETMGREVSRLAGGILFNGRQPVDASFRTSAPPFVAVNETTCLALGISIPEGLAVDAVY